MESKKTDLLEEILKVLYLESVTDASAEEELSRIVSTVPALEMHPEKKAKLFEMLSGIQPVITLGEIIGDRLKKLRLGAEQLSRNTLLPLSVIQELLEDKIYTNNVPIMLFQNLLKQLGISFQEVEKSIRNTFALLHEKTAVSGAAYGLNPAFRKGSHPTLETMDAYSKGDGSELYENKEALDKYLIRLNELLID